MHGTVIEAGFLGEPARRQARVTDVRQQSLGLVLRHPTP
jgi:hypothetical protein